MMFFGSLLFTSFVLGASAVTISSLRSRGITYSTTPTPPSQDPWYTVPANFENTAPGTILRVRVAPGNIPSIIGNCSQAYHLLYRTTDARYRPSWAVTTLYVPLSPTNATSSGSTGDALLSYQFPYNSADVDSSPSYTWAAGVQSPDLPNALGLGWYVNFPDFEGPLAAFPAGIQEGHAVLDSIRAVLSSGFGLSPSTRYAMWGYSGGSVSSTWAAELQAAYAPELNFSGMAIGGIVPNVTNTFNLISGNFYAGLLPAGLLGITAQYPEAREYLVSRLKINGTYNATTFLKSLDIDFETGNILYQYQDIFNYFIGGKADLEVPLIQDIFNANGYQGYHGIPQMPTFVYKAIHDELSPVEDSDALVDRYCSVRANILYQRNTVGSHLDEDSNGDARAFEWLKTVLNGSYGSQYSTEGCTIQNVTVGVWNATLLV
ncbi:related to lipase 1 [Phialocephala subalpina]|uniref:Related to lipase 1 n=1 Tax=Phialocephala subalpina TaxID=576137 RepID=A0A1L7XV71_9HELO|nr:related to lipase 1 [Phialocephala subalpina]